MEYGARICTAAAEQRAHVMGKNTKLAYALLRKVNNQSNAKGPHPVLITLKKIKK